jgi:hypothetical protein
MLKIGEAALETVATGLHLTFRSTRDRGFLRVYAICVYLFLRGHK